MRKLQLVAAVAGNGLIFANDLREAAISAFYLMRGVLL
jgi:hypothetical protein